jgi:hypothetical protein
MNFGRTSATGCVISLTAALKTNSRPTMTIEVCLGNEYKSRTELLKGSFKHLGGVKFFFRKVLREAKENFNTPGEYRAGPPSIRYVALNLCWPVALSDAADWKAWNSAIEREAAEMAEVGPPEYAWDGDTGNTDAGGEVYFVNSQIVAATVESDWDGGAHPNWASEQFNWLLREHRQLRAEDIFKVGTGWDKVIRSNCDKGLRKQLGEDYASYSEPGKLADTLHRILIDPKNWEIDRKELTVVFRDYADSPHVSPAMPVTTTWTQLKSYLNPGFEIPN